MKTFLRNNIFCDFTVADPLFIVNMHISHYKKSHRCSKQNEAKQFLC